METNEERQPREISKETKDMLQLPNRHFRARTPKTIQGIPDTLETSGGKYKCRKKKK